MNIQLGRDAFLRVAGHLYNMQGSIDSEGDLSIIAGGHLANVSALIQSTGGLSIAAHSITHQTLVYRYNHSGGNQQGTRYGDIAAINAVNGDLVLRSHSDIQFYGAQASAGGSLTLAADGNIYVGSQQVQTQTGSAGSAYQASTVSYLQSRLTAAETLQLIANGEIVIDAAELVSDRGHIDILAGMGITIEDDLRQSQFLRTFKSGHESAYKTVAMRALLDAGKGIRIHSEFGDITLKAADIRSTEGASVTASGGGVNLLMTVENDHYSYAATKSGRV